MDVSAELDALRRRAEKLAARRPATSTERWRKWNDKRKEQRARNIAVIDFETDPFDNTTKVEVFPFVACLYSDQFEPVTIWENDHDVFVDLVLDCIRNLPDSFTIYAHNGGKFDFMFLIHKLRGEISFKGRGIMRATIGAHELRDSFHILPERLASMQKSKFDYKKLRKHSRDNHKQEIIDYCMSDCKNLFDYVKKFIDQYGFKISIGAASMACLRQHYKPQSIMPIMDERLRSYYKGGRVECLQGAGYWRGNFKLYDVNSMYPYVMASYKHPIGSEYVFRDGLPNENTVFLRIACLNKNALLGFDDNGTFTSRVTYGEFTCSKFEYDTALELGLISDVKILECVDNFQLTTFEKFVTPLYTQRAAEKAHLKTCEPGTAEYQRTNAHVLFLKLILNNAYGKFAQNPRRYKQFYLTDAGEKPPIDPSTGSGYGDLPEYMASDYWLWARPDPKQKFLNVGTAASITGAARSILMRAIHFAKNPIYCDTDSLICEELYGCRLHDTELGAWDLEKRISELIVCGKKLYAYKSPGSPGQSPVTTIRSKGASGLTWSDMAAILCGETRHTVAEGPTLTRQQKHFYMERDISLTAWKSDGFDDRHVIDLHQGVLSGEHRFDN